jgi:DNA gyrase/topoisomerase IV subunit A
MTPSGRIEQINHLRQRLTTLRGLSAAIERKTEVLQILSEPSNEAVKISTLQELLLVDEASARAIIELQWDQLPGEPVAHIGMEIQETQEILHTLERGSH